MMTIIIIALAGIMLAAYSLPWVTHLSASLSFNAYDLAEWTTLNPGVRGTDLGWFIPLALRGQLLFIGITLVLWVPSRWLSVGVLLSFFVALLPPFEFFSGSMADPNYRQQFALALTMAVMGLACLRSFSSPLRRTMQNVLITVSLLTGLFGQFAAYALQHEIIPSPQIGAGFVLFMIAHLALGICINNRGNLLTSYLGHNAVPRTGSGAV
jgi:hypothetical protein